MKKKLPEKEENSSSNYMNTFDEAALADLRHDLKNKLATIYGYTELLLTKLKNEKQRKWAEEILLESKILKDIIDNKIR